MLRNRANCCEFQGRRSSGTGSDKDRKQKGDKFPKQKIQTQPPSAKQRPRPSQTANGGGWASPRELEPERGWSLARRGRRRREVGLARAVGGELARTTGEFLVSAAAARGEDEVLQRVEVEAERGRAAFQLSTFATETWWWTAQPSQLFLLVVKIYTCRLFLVGNFPQIQIDNQTLWRHSDYLVLKNRCHESSSSENRKHYQNICKS